MKKPKRLLMENRFGFDWLTVGYFTPVKFEEALLAWVGVCDTGSSPRLANFLPISILKAER
jgi:hypothetical protein